MRKTFAVLLVALLCLSFCACQKSNTDTDESTVNTTEESYQGLASSVASDETVAKALEAYAAYIAPFSGEDQKEDEGITSAVVVDLDKNNIPEVIFTYYGLHNMYILSYGENNGLSVISPVLHSSTPAEVYFSEDNAILYYTDSGHNQGTSWYHEGVCLKATSEGFETVGTVSGDTWEDVTEEIWNSEELFVEIDKKYDNAFDENVNKLIGDGKYVSFFDTCEKENAEKYLEEKLSVDLAAKKAEYSEFKETALSAIGSDPLSIHVNDYDRNGTYEAFALVAKELEGLYEGVVWFVSDNGKAKVVYDNYGYWSKGEILECQYNSYYQIDLASGSSAPSALWKVFAGECVEIKTFNQNGVESFRTTSLNGHSNSLIATLNGFDMILEDIDDSGSGAGHTHKPYFYYDTPDGIKEYGGIEITEAQLEALGGRSYIDLIKDEGYTVRDIYVRENGIININFYKYDSEGFHECNYINLRMMNSGVSAVDRDLQTGEIPYELDEIMGEGFYEAASVPEIATYSETATIPVTEAKTENIQDIKTAYRNILYDIGKNPENYYEGGNTEENSFAVADITGDGVPELLVCFEGTYMAAMKMTVWTYENEKAVVLTECGAYDSFYKDGYIKSDDYHNHTKGETIWPFMIDKCDFNSGEIETIHWIFCRDEGYMDSEDDPFPHAEDADSDGVIYYICDADDDYDEGKASTKAEYEEIVNKYIPEKNKIDIEYSKLTKENIEKVK